MRLAPPAQLSVRARQDPARNELLLRYAAAYSCTLIAILGAQLYIPTVLSLILAAITLAGLPISLYLRRSNLRVFGRQIPRLVINSVMMTITVFACGYFLMLAQPELFSRSLYHTVLLASGPGDSIAILMTMFLLFAAIRSLAIINDKDAVLSAVPSFSVLLLLIVLHKGPEVVAYFLLWIFVTALLFALDHRAEARLRVTGFVPAALPGQDAALSARALVGVLALSLFFASVLSYFLVSRDPNQRGTLENSIINLASRLNGLADLTDVSVNNGPERQIDFSAGPALPTRKPLWEVRAYSPDGKQLQPQYWRMFTLARYDGRTWTQTPGSGDPVALGPLSWRAWPMFSPSRVNKRLNKRLTEQELAERGRRYKAYDIAAQAPGGETAMAQFGTPTVPVLQAVKALESSSGYLPVLPSLRALQFPGRYARSSVALRVRGDRAVDIGVLENNRSAWVLSDLPALPEYGVRDNAVPTRRGAALNPRAQLSALERRVYLQLPTTSLPQRVRDFARNSLRNASSEESAYRHAQRLSIAIQSAAIYTLRPPPTPATRDAVDYFLFDSGRGYCTYFASALTVLCRAQGIPARMVSGFTNTEWSLDGQGSSVGTIREANAHTWTEVWVDGWGWASVDATPADDRGDNAPTVWNDVGTALGGALGDAWKWIRARGWLAAGAVSYTHLTLPTKRIV